MTKLLKLLAITVLLTVAGCSNSADGSDEEQNVEIRTESVYFVGTIKEIIDNKALVSATIIDGNPEGNVFVNLSVNSDETFQVGDKVKVGYDGTIMESNPAQINTLSVKLID